MSLKRKVLSPVGQKPKNVVVRTGEDIKQYIDHTVEREHNIVMPKIEATSRKVEVLDTRLTLLDSKVTVIDKRDVEQFALAKAQMSKYDELLTWKNQFQPEHAGVLSGLASLHAKIDAHLADETNQFDVLHKRMAEAAGHVANIQFTLDNTSANGTKGLSQSLTDIYHKLEDLETITAGQQARAKMWKYAAQSVATTPILRPLKHLWGALLYAAIFLLIVNTIIHALGITWDLLGLFRWAAGVFGLKV